MATNKPQGDYQKTALRLPQELHARVHEAAAAAGRSFNAEIIARLETSFTDAAELARSAEKMAQMDRMLSMTEEMMVQLKKATSSANEVLDQLAEKVAGAPSATPPAGHVAPAAGKGAVVIDEAELGLHRQKTKR